MRALGSGAWLRPAAHWLRPRQHQRNARKHENVSRFHGNGAGAAHAGSALRARRHRNRRPSARWRSRTGAHTRRTALVQSGRPGPPPGSRTAPERTPLRAALAQRGGRIAARHCASTCSATTLHEVLVNQIPAFGVWLGSPACVGDDGVASASPHLHERPRACAPPRPLPLARIFRVLHEVSDDLVDGNRAMVRMPAVVIGHHGHRDVAELGFTRQLGFGEVGHTDHIHAQLR